MKNIISKKPSYFDGLKKIFYVILKPNLTRNEVSKFLECYEIDGSIVKRLYTMVYNMPNILIFLNRYTNNLYDKEPNLVDFIFSLRYILKINNSLSNKYIHYHKSNENKIILQQQLINLFKEYFSQQYNNDLNYHELKFLYKLFLINHITDKDIIDIDLLINNNKQTINLNSNYVREKLATDDKINVTVQELINNQQELSKFLIDYNNELQKNKLEKCSNSCSLFNNTFVNIDGNISNYGDVDIVIINLFSKLEDSNRNKILSEKNNIIRQNIELFPNTTKWLLINQICCSVKNKSHLGSDDNLHDIIEMCNFNIIDKVINDFPSKKYIIIGEELFNKYIKIKYNNFDYQEYIGAEIDNYFIASQTSNKFKNQLDEHRNLKMWENVQNWLRKPVEIKKIQPNISSDKKIIDEKIYLLDIKELSNDEVLLIYTDSNGKKIYRKENNKTISYIKNKDFKSCDIITDDVDSKFSMTKLQKLKLSNLLKLKMKELKDI